MWDLVDVHMKRGELKGTHRVPHGHQHGLSAPLEYPSQLPGRSGDMLGRAKNDRFLTNENSTIFFTHLNWDVINYPCHRGSG